MKSTLKKARQSMLAVLVSAVLFASASIAVRAQTPPACSPNCQNANLSNANLAGLNLSGINFQGAILTGANLQNANLQGDNLQGADLANATLTGAILNGNGTNLQNSILNHANLSGAQLQDVSLQYATLFGANLSGAYLQGADLQQANLSYAILTGWNTQGANLQGVDFANAVGGPGGPPPLSGPVLGVVGDIACQPGSEETGEKNGYACDDPSTAYSGGYTSTILVQSQSATATQIEDMNPAPAAVALLGDLQYQVARYSDFTGSFDTTYGQFKNLHEPAPGNHEFYSEHGETGVAGYGYFSYYNGYETDTNGNVITTTITDPCKTPGIAGDPQTSCKAGASTPDAQPVPLPNGQAGQFQESGGLESTIPAGGAVGVGNGYYSYNLGSWHLISLNIECYPQPGGCSNTGTWFAAELAWLQSDLSANDSACTLAYWHQPTFSATNSITEEGITAQAFWNLLYQYKADVVLNGHDHLYAHYIPLNPSGNYDPIQGIRQFTVGTGGETLDPIVAAGASSETLENPGGNTLFNESNLESYSGDYWGVMALTLGSNSYSWAYTSALQGPAGLVPLNGPTFPAGTNGDYSDSGFGTCHGGQQASNLNEVTFTTPAPASAEYGSTFTVAASGLGTGAITYTSDGVVCANSGAAYTMISGSGTCTVTATQAADSNYASASASESVTAQPAQGSVSVSLTAGNNPSTYGDSITFTATVSSDTGTVKGRKTTKRPRDLNGSVSWSANTGCSSNSVSGNPPQTATCTTSILSGGTDTVTATYTASDSNHTTATGSISQTVHKADQTITVTQAAPSTAIEGSSFTVAATASSGLPITYTSGGSCTSSGATYTITAGAKANSTCTVDFFQTGNGNYNAAIVMTETVTVAAATAPMVSFTGPSPASAAYGTTFTATASSSDDTAIPAISVEAASAGICQINSTSTNGTSVAATVQMLVGAGSCKLMASWPTTTEYKAATKMVSVAAKKAAAGATLSGAPSTAAKGSSFTVTATAASDATPTITVSPATVCTVGSATSIGGGSYQATVTMIKATGTCTTKATWATDANYLAGTASETTTAN